MNTNETAACELLKNIRKHKDNIPTQIWDSLSPESQRLIEQGKTYVMEVLVSSDEQEEILRSVEGQLIKIIQLKTIDSVEEIFFAYTELSQQEQKQIRLPSNLQMDLQKYLQKREKGLLTGDFPYNSDADWFEGSDKPVYITLIIMFGLALLGEIFNS